MFEQIEDEHGVMRLDRRLTVEEAAAQDAATSPGRLGSRAKLHIPFRDEPGNKAAA